jgi:hypothetical protein
MEMLGEICKKRMGEIEVHLHHDNDTSNNLRDTLLQYKRNYINNTSLEQE